MKKPLQIVMALALCVAAPLLPGRRQRAACGEEPPKPTTIPKDQIYTTCDENSPKYLSYGEGDPDYRVFRKFITSFESGASNVFLVRGDDVVDAMKASQLIFGEGVSAREAVQPSWDVKSSQVWFGAYFGIWGSSPPRWTIRSVELDGKRIRLSYSENEAPVISPSIRRYLAMTALGKLPPGTYTLELFDANNNEMTLSRRVRVN